jgi:hemerythrin
MPALKWSTANAVFVREIDDEHKEIFEALAEFEKILAADGKPRQLRRPLERLTECITAHFEHEERLMRAARYESLRWHKQGHSAALRMTEAFITRIERGDAEAGTELVESLASWLHNHTRVADRMMGAALRNHRRCMWKVTFQAGTKPADACTWVRINGERMEPPAREGKA